MLRPPSNLILAIFCFVILAGCNPQKPFYLRDYGDLSYYIDQQVETKYPDVESVTIEETANAHAPLTVGNESITNFADMTLEDAISIALQNSKVLRGYGTPGLQGNVVAPGVDGLANGPAGAGTIYDVAIRESEPGFLGTPGQASTPSNLATNTGLDSNQGVEAALAEFDAAFTSSMFWNKSDRPQNFVIPGLDSRRLQDFNGNFAAELSKKTAVGTQLFFRNTVDYRRNNNPLSQPGPDGVFGTADDTGAQRLSSTYTAALELEARQPLLRGRGAFINRMPVVFARIGTDQQLASIEAQLQNMLCNVEIRYWDLQCAYRTFEAAKEGREGALDVYNKEKDRYDIGARSKKSQGGTIQSVAQAQEQYFFFRSEVERRYAEMLDAESDLRWLLGWATTDGRFIRPTDDPISTKIDFEWCQALNEALSLKPQIRQERWELKKRQLAVAYSKNGLLPTLNAVGAYSWVGLGDDLLGGGRNGINFPNPNSNALDSLTEGDFQEYRFGLEFGMPVGFRRELANVRNAQLKVARETARLEDMELDTARELASAYRALETNHKLAQSHYNRWTSAETEVKAFKDLEEAGQATTDVKLDGQRRLAQAKVAYYASICEYNKTIALMHLRKGTVMQYNSIQFGEGPWPGKAYDDAMEHARRRGASREMNYGFTRPGVVSNDFQTGAGAPEGEVYYEGGEVIIDNGVAPLNPVEIPQHFTPTPAQPMRTPELIQPGRATPTTQIQSSVQQNQTGYAPAPKSQNRQVNATQNLQPEPTRSVSSTRTTYSQSPQNRTSLKSHAAIRPATHLQ